MKAIKYKFLSAEVNRGSEEKPNMERIFLDKTVPWNETNEEIARREAHNGEYIIEDDGLEEVNEPTDAERIAELEEALNLLLSGVTE